MEALGCNVWRGNDSSTNPHKVVIDLREKWAKELTFQRFIWEEMKKELEELNKFKAMQQDKDQMYALVHEMLSCRSPSPSYSIFIYDQFTLFKLKSIREGRHSKMATTSQFLEKFP